MIESLLALAIDRAPELWLRTGEHLMLTGVSTVAAVVAGIPLGIWASRSAWLRGPLTGAVGILQTIPSLAMLAILLALLQRIGALPAIIALTLYALLPIVRNTTAGLDGVSGQVREAARGIGMTSRQSLWMIEIPLAMPVMMAGIRTAAVVGVGIATLSAFIGAGGLGQFINRGLALSNTNLILLGAIPAAVLALVVDGAIAALQWGLHAGPRRGPAWLRSKAARRLAMTAPLMLALVGFVAFVSSGQATRLARPADAVVRVGSKNFTEQLILGELIGQLIEGRTDLAVERRFNLGGTMICHGALVNGEIDVYAEYTGTALTAILQLPVIADADSAYDVVAAHYRAAFQARWLKPFGFNNTYAITMRRSDAEARGVRTISDLARAANELRAGFTPEFSERPDGYLGLRKAYGFRFGEVVDLDPAIMYQAVAKDEVDVICAFATDGRVAAFDLQPLTDDRGFFPPYYAAPVVRMETLRAHPEIPVALAPLSGRLDDATMQRLNFEVDEGGASPRDVAGRFLREQGLIE